MLAAARKPASGKVVSFEAGREVGPLECLPTILARNARNTDLVIVGEPDQANSPPVVSQALCRPGASSSPGMARAGRHAVYDAMSLIRMADDMIILSADAQPPTSEQDAD